MGLAADGATGAVERGAALSSTGVVRIESMAITSSNPLVAGIGTLSNHFWSLCCSLEAPADLSSMSFIPFIIGHCDMDSLPICMCSIMCCIIASSIWAFRASMAKSPDGGGDDAAHDAAHADGQGIHVAVPDDEGYEGHGRQIGGRFQGTTKRPEMIAERPDARDERVGTSYGHRLDPNYAGGR